MIAAAFLTYRPSALWPKARSQLASPFSMASARARSLFTTLSPLYRTYVAFSLRTGVEFTGNRRPISGWESVLNAARSSSIDGETSADLRSRNMSRGDSPPSGSCSLYGFAVTSEIISSSLRLPAMSSKSRDSPSGTTNTVEISRTLNPSECASMETSLISVCGRLRRRIWTSLRQRPQSSRPHRRSTGPEHLCCPALRAALRQSPYTAKASAISSSKAVPGRLSFRRGVA